MDNNQIPLRDINALSISGNIPEQKDEQLNKQVKIEPKTIVFCLPGNQYSNTFLLCWTNLINYCNSVGHRIIISQAYNPNVYFVRNECLGGDFSKGIVQKPFEGKLDYDFMFWIDSDIVFNPKQIQDLIDMDKDISSGCYIMKNNTEYAIVEHMDLSLLRQKKSFKFMTRDDMKDKKEQFKVDYVGFGFICIKKGIMESLTYPFFKPYLHELVIDGVYVRDYSSEDVSWCIDVRKNGYEIWVNPNIKVGHEKLVILA
jgi:hypothetical protein